MAPLPSLVFNPTTTIGAVQLGGLASCALFGVTTTQAYIYYTRFPEDTLKLKSLVAFVCLCETAHVICVTQGLFSYIVLDHGRPELLLQGLPVAFDLIVFFTGISTAAVQGFFSLRVYTFSKNLPILATFIGLLFLYVLATTTLFVYALRSVTFTEYLDTWGNVILATWTLSAVVDLGIATTLVFFLYRNRTNALKRTVALVDKVIKWTIETGLLTSFFSILTLACYATMKYNFIWVGLLAVKARLFANSLLASLNSRATLRAMNSKSVVPLTVPATGLTPGKRKLEWTSSQSTEVKTNQKVARGRRQTVHSTITGDY